VTQTRVTKDAFRSCARNITMRHFLLLAVGNHVVPAQQLAASASIHVDEDLSRDLRRRAENFVYTAARAYKEGMKRFGKAMGKDISFMFQKQPAYERALIVLRSTDPGLADYLRETRTLWSERLIEKRNDIDHNGWSLPRIEYRLSNGRVEAKQPLIDGQTTVEFIEFMFDRLSCFVEDFTAHCLQSRMPQGVAITEIPMAERVPESPERFRLTLQVGGLPKWKIRYRTAPFDSI
jgi:hypothetical protein